MQSLEIEPEAIPTLTYEQIGYREKLLCHDCEQRFASVEKYVKESVTVMLPSTAQDIIELNVDATLVRKFALSLLWRCSITSNPQLRINIGPHSENLRLILDSDASMPDDYCFLFLAAMTNQDGSLQKQLIDVGTGGRVSGLRTIRLVCGGIIWCFLLGAKGHVPNLGSDSEGYFVKRGESIVIVPQKMSGLPFMMERAQIIFGSK